jgi:FkbM family methyltransferase
MQKFKYDTFDIICPQAYSQFLNEVFIFDVYRTDLLKQDELVLDLGAGVGDFSILASKRIGDKGKVVAIEPNPEDFELLKSNIERNCCKNIIPLNLAVGNKPAETEMTFWGRKFSCKIDVLENILHRLNIKDKLGFVKMDIEGFESDVVTESIEIIKEANVISVECHGTKEKLDEMLLPHGFYFRPINYSYFYKKMLKTLVSHPSHFFRTSFTIVRNNPGVIYKTITGYDTATQKAFMGSYIKETKTLHS